MPILDVKNLNNTAVGRLEGCSRSKLIRTSQAWSLRLERRLMRLYIPAAVWGRSLPAGNARSAARGESTAQHDLRNVENVELTGTLNTGDMCQPV